MTEKKKAKPNDPLPMFAKKLREHRAELNWSLRDAEKRAGGNISRQTFLRAENGDVLLDNLLRIMNLLNIPKREQEKMMEDFNEHLLARAKKAA